MGSGWILRSLAILGVLASSPSAHAQAQVGQAETLFRKGRELLAAGKTAEACAAFESSQRLEAAVTTLMNIGACREKNGQLATAWGAFVEAQRELRGASDESSQQLATVASTRAAKLELRLSKLTIVIASDHAIAGLEVRRGTEIVDAGTWNTSLPIDGGTYTITARAPGHVDWSTSVTLANEGDSKSVEVPLLAVPEAPRPHDEPKRVDRPPTTSTDHTAPSRLPTIVAAAGGGALLAGALIAELLGQSKISDARAAGDMGDRDTAYALWHQANTRRYVAEGLLGAGIAAAGVSVYLFLRARPAESSHVATSSTRHVAPVLTTSFIGITGEL